MRNNNQILTSLNEAKELSQKHGVPLVDILLLGLNMEGANNPLISTGRMRFKISPDLTNGKDFYCAITNNPNSRWEIIDGIIQFKGSRVGSIDGVEEDTCDSTYWRRFETIEGKIKGTELTINSNSKSFCSGCEFCGTYNLNPKDQEEKDLSTPKKVRKKIEALLDETGVEDLSHLVGAGIVTGCFPDEEMTLYHLNMLHDVLRQEYGFKGELKYIGAQIRSKKSLESLAAHGPTGIAQTVECFTRRDELLQPKKRITLDHSREILAKAKDLGITTSILYIMGLDNLDIFQEEMEKFIPHLTKMPLINTLQEYLPGQSKLRVQEARSMEYYLKARKIMEKIAVPFNFKPNVWENYRGLWFTGYDGGNLDAITI